MRKETTRAGNQPSRNNIGHKERNFTKETVVGILDDDTGRSNDGRAFKTKDTELRLEGEGIGGGARWRTLCNNRKDAEQLKSQGSKLIYG